MFLLVAWVVINAWDFIIRANHPAARLLISLLVLAVVVGILQLFKKKN
jgi:hypothetical protein